MTTQFKKGYITDPFTMMINCEWNNGGEKNFRNDIWNMLQLIVYSISLGQGEKYQILAQNNHFCKSLPLISPDDIDERIHNPNFA